MRTVSAFRTMEIVVQHWFATNWDRNLENRERQVIGLSQLKELLLVARVHASNLL